MPQAHESAGAFRDLYIRKNGAVRPRFTRKGYAEFDVDAADLLDYFGERSPRRCSARIRNAYARAAEEIADAAAPRVAYALYPLHSDDGGMRVGDFLLETKKINAAFRHCDVILMFALTLGEGVDEKIVYGQAENATYGYTIDQCASWAAEFSAEFFRQAVDRGLPANRGVTFRYSPGYCDWALEEQRKVFRLLPDRPAGVELSASCLMNPRKSISGAMAIGPRTLTHRGNACLYCGGDGCEHRRI